MYPRPWGYSDDPHSLDWRLYDLLIRLCCGNVIRAAYLFDSLWRRPLEWLYYHLWLRYATCSVCGYRERAWSWEQMHNPCPACHAGE